MEVLQSNIQTSDEEDSDLELFANSSNAESFESHIKIKIEDSKKQVFVTPTPVKIVAVLKSTPPIIKYGTIAKNQSLPIKRVPRAKKN